MICRLYVDQYIKRVGFSLSSSAGDAGVPLSRLRRHAALYLRHSLSPSSLGENARQGVRWQKCGSRGSMPLE